MRVVCLVIATACLLAACATPVRERPLLAVDEVTALQWRSFVDEKLRGQVRLGEVRGADAEARGYLQQTLDRVWASRTPQKVVADALEEQLQQLRLLAGQPDTARYALDVELLSVEADGLLLGSEGEAELHYRLRALDSGRVVYERRLRSQGEVPVGLLWPPLRQRAAKESALRANLLRAAGELARLRV